MEPPHQTIVLEGEHSQEVTQATFNPAGTHVLIANRFNAALYDASSGKHIRSLIAQNSSFENFLRAKWSPLGTYIIGKYLHKSCAFQTAHIWDKDGQWLYKCSYPSRTKIYFTPNDRQLIEKSEKDFWHVKESATGNTLVILGNPTDDHRKVAQDPLGQWIAIYDGKKSCFHDAKNFALIKTVKGLVRCFSSDGTRFVTREDYAHTCRVFNRSFERLFKLPDMRCSFDFTSDNMLLICFLIGIERHFNAHSGVQVNFLNNHSDYSNSNILEFASKDADATIKCIPTYNPRGTNICIIAANCERSLHVSSQIRNIFYTRIKDVIGLGKYNSVEFLMHVPSGRIIPCTMNSGRKTVLFSRKPMAVTTADGRYLEFQQNSLIIKTI